MKKFIFRIALFLAPIAVVILPPAYVLFSTGENFKDVTAVIKGDDKYLFGYAYNGNNYRYIKWKTLTEMPRYDVVALGSSRVLQFRKQMFTGSFYNAGFTITSIDYFMPFIKSLPKDKYPKYLIIGLDQWMFNKAHDKLVVKPDSNLWETSFQKNPDLQILKKVWLDLYKHKISFFPKPKQDTLKRIGLNAIINNKGFRNDGSIYYGQQIPQLLSGDTTVEDYKFKRTLGYIKKGDIRFEYGSEIHDKALTELDKFLAFCKSNNIIVIGFLPPFSDLIYNKAMTTGDYTYWPKVYPAADPIFKRYGFELYDYSQLASIGANDNEAIDGFHMGEVAYLRIVLEMLKSNSVLNNVSAIEKLKGDLIKPIDRYDAYGY